MSACPCVHWLANYHCQWPCRTCGTIMVPIKWSNSVQNLAQVSWNCPLSMHTLAAGTCNSSHSLSPDTLGTLVVGSCSNFEHWIPCGNISAAGRTSLHVNGNSLWELWTYLLSGLGYHTLNLKHFSDGKMLIKCCNGVNHLNFQHAFLPQSSFSPSLW